MRTTRAALAVSVLAILACGGVETNVSTSSSSSSSSSAPSAATPSTAGSGGGGGSAVERKWAKEVLLGTEFGGAGALTARYTRDVTVSAFSASAAQKRLLAEVVAELDPLIEPLDMTLGADANARANMKVYFVPLREFDAIGKKNNFPVVPNNYGYFWTFWDGNHALTFTHVLIGEDVLSGNQLRHYVFEEVTQALGLSSDSPRFADSVFYSDGNKHGEATTLSARDKKLVRMAYKIPPRSTEAGVDRAFDQYWGR